MQRRPLLRSTLNNNHVHLQCTSGDLPTLQSIAACVSTLYSCLDRQDKSQASEIQIANGPPCILHLPVMPQSFSLHPFNTIIHLLYVNSLLRQSVNKSPVRAVDCANLTEHIINNSYTYIYIYI